MDSLDIQHLSTYLFCPFYGSIMRYGILLLLILTSPTFAADPEVEKLKARVESLEAEVRELKRLLAALKPVEPNQPGVLKIQAAKDNWGDAGSNDVQAVCKSAAQELWKHIPNRTIEPIMLSYNKRGPMTIFGLGNEKERRVWLNVQGAYWSQYAYQFAHEFCHILCNYREADSSNHWFEESLCETASLFVLRRMAESWKTNPPYSTWKGYSTSLKNYIDDHMRKTEKLEDLTLAQWYLRNEEALRKNSTDRPKNQIVAQQLLPLFEKNPEHWAALGFLNQWDKTKTLTFAEYLSDWHQRVPQKHQEFIQEIAKLFEIKLKQ